MGAAHSDDGSGTEFTTATSNNTCTIGEIEEENPNKSSEAGYWTPTPGVTEEDVYVVVGNNRSSMDALEWTLKNIVTPSTVVYLVHVFPAVRRIPTPLGRMLRSEVAPELVESYLSQEREKKRVMLQEFWNLCAASKVKVDTLLIENNITEKAILRLIPVENIQTLVLGTTKSNIRKGRGKARQIVSLVCFFMKGRGKARYIVKKAPKSCSVRIICEGKEVTEQMISSRSGPFCCTCFSTKFT